MITTIKPADVERPNKLPEGWKWIPLGSPNVSEIIMGQSPPSTSYNSIGQGLPFFQGKAEFGDLYPNPVKWCTKPQKIANPGDVLISVRAPVGPTNLVKEKCCIGRGLAAIRSTKNILTQYLLYFLRSFEVELSTQGRGSTFASISKTDLSTVSLPIPFPDNPIHSLNIQGRIVARIEALLAEVRESRSLIAQIRRDQERIIYAALEEVFTEIVSTHQLEQLKNHVLHLTSGSRSWSKYASPTNIGSLFIRVGNVGFSRMDLSEIEWLNLPTNLGEAERSKVASGDVLVTITGTIGRCCVVPKNIGEAYVNQHVALLRLKQSLEPRYLMWFILSPSGGATQTAKMQYGQTKPGLSLTNVRNLSLPVPEKSVQRQVVAYLDSIQHEVDKMLILLNRDAELLAQLEQTILEQAFRGEL